MGHQFQGAALQFYALPGNAQADSGALYRPDSFGVTLEKRFKHAFGVLCWNGSAGIGHINDQITSFFAPHNVKDMKQVRLGGENGPRLVLVANNQSWMQAILNQSATSSDDQLISLK